MTQRSSRRCGRCPKPGDQREDFLEHLSRHRDLGHLLVWTAPDGIERARMRSLRAHIAEDNPAAAKRVALHILHCVEGLLAQHPKLGAPGRVPGTRELVIPKTPYIVPYRVRGSRIEIARVYHSARRWPDRL
jgi:toxin ParE1/3/4